MTTLSECFVTANIHCLTLIAYMITSEDSNIIISYTFSQVAVWLRQMFCFIIYFMNSTSGPEKTDAERCFQSCDPTWNVVPGAVREPTVWDSRWYICLYTTKGCITKWKSLTHSCYTSIEHICSFLSTYKHKHVTTWPMIWFLSTKHQWREHSVQLSSFALNNAIPSSATPPEMLGCRRLSVAI